MGRKLIIVSLLLFSINMLAQTPQAVLTSADVDRYIETFIPMNDELNALNDDMDDTDDEDSDLADMWEYAEARTIFQKYGWDETFAPKFMAIITGTFYLRMKQQLESLPKEQADNMKGMMSLYDNKVHADDLDLIRDRLDELQELLGSMEEEDEEDY